MWRQVCSKGCMGWIDLSIDAIPVVIFFRIGISSLQYKVELEEVERKKN